MSVNIDTVWTAIIAHQGEPFHQIRGKEFTYNVKGDAVVLHTTRQSIYKSEFVKALDRIPFENTVALRDWRVPSHVFAVLIDTRTTG